MKPFNLEAAKAGDPIVTRYGTKAEFIAHIPHARIDSRVVALVGDMVKSYHESGTYFIDPTEPVSDDLFMAPKKRTVWVNFYDHAFGAAYYNTEDEANNAAMVTRKGGKAYPVEIEE